MPAAPTTPRGLFVGRSVLDVIQLVDERPPADGKIRSTRHTVAAGGPASNAALLFTALGGRAELFSRVGPDPLGTALLDDLRAHCSDRLHHHNLWDPSDRAYTTVPSTIAVTASTGHRSVVVGATHPDANTGTLDHSHDHHVSADLGVVLVDSDETDVSRSLTTRARELGVPTVIDVGSEKEVTALQLPGIDVAIVAEDFRHATPDEIIDHLEAAGVRYGAVTRGPRPLRHFSPAGRGWLTRPAVPEVVDTLGAGDFFHGAYCFALARTGLDAVNHVRALEWASSVSELSIQHFGPRSWLAHLDTLPPAPSPSVPSAR